jgi:hypothetical protein
MDLGMDKDMFMALGIDNAPLPGAGVEPGVAGGNWAGGEGPGGEERDWSELDFDQWVDGMGGVYQ